MVLNRHTPSYQAHLSAQQTALEAIASVVVMRLERDRNQATSGAAPVLIEVDGPGNTDVVDMVAGSLRNRRPDELGLAVEPHHRRPMTPHVDRPAVRWGVIRFDAWQFQRVAPPWWWLVTALDRQLREQLREEGGSVLRRNRRRDYGWRFRHFLGDFRAMAPLLIAAIALWVISGQLSMGKFLSWAVGVTGGLTTLTALLWSATNVVRRLLIASPANLTASTRSTDPMADLRLRYEFLIRSSDRPLALVIDNLDRCQAGYVVELLEGIQTLLRNPDEAIGSNRLVAVLVPAQQGWLCDSYLQVYKDFQNAMRQPGRPFGLAFLDRVFDLTVRVPSTMVTEKRVTHPRDASGRVTKAQSELEVRRLVAEAERCYADGLPLPEMRSAAVRRIGTLQVASSRRSCLDTDQALADLVEAVEPGQTVMKQLSAAYCVQRTAQLLGGHPIDTDEYAIHRLALWTTLTLRWPLLGRHLARYPDHLDLLLRGVVPPALSEDLTEVWDDPEVAQLITSKPGLTPDGIRRFAAFPLDRAPTPPLSLVEPDGDAPRSVAVDCQPGARPPAD